MKKLLYCAAAFATLLFAASCQQEELAPAVDNSTVTFTVEAPAAFQTKAIADGQNVDQLVYEVWLTETLGDLTKGAEKLYQATADMVSDGNVNKATLTLDLVKDQKFTVLFWAQVESSAAYNTEELTAVTYAKDAYDSNDEGLAAFYSVAYVDDNKHVTKEGNATTGTVVLRRPFAQLNLGTLNTAVYDVKVLKSEVTVSDVNTVFNVATSVASEAKSMTFDMAEVPADPSTITVNGVEYVYVAMNYVFASDNATVSYDLETSIKGNTTNVTNEVTSVPLKENYRTNIIGNLLTGNTDFDIIVDEGFAGGESKDANTDYVTNDAELAAALKQDKRDIIIDLAQEEVTKATTPKTYNVTIGAWTETYYFGGETTRTITINANGNTINFVHENSDWNYIRCVNDAVVWTINDAALTNSGENDGPWNRHDIRFYNSVVLNDVTSDKAIALLNDGKLNNVTITEATEAYGLWITAEGQTVDINGLNITATNGGRGIAIKDQYVESPACVTLNVADATFETAKKAAVLVTSTAGAVINWGKGNDISAVAADPINAVWVDENRADYASEVQVYGATLAIEGQVEICTVATTDELVAALKDGQSYIYLEAGNYALAKPTIAASNVMIYGKDRENCVITLTKQLRATDGVTVLTLKNLTLDVPTGLDYTEHTFAWIHYLKEFNMVDCNSNGRVRLNTNSANIEGCNFEVTTSSGFDGYAIQYQGANNSTTTVKDCVFNTQGKAIVMYNEGKPVLNLDVENCTFNSSDASTDKAAIQMHTEYGISGTLDINRCTATGFADINGGLWNELNNNTKVPTNNFKITIDGNLPPIIVTPENLASTDFNQSRTFKLVGDFTTITNVNSITPTEGVVALIDASGAKFGDKIQFNIPQVPDQVTNVSRNNGRKGSYTLSNFNGTTLDLGAYGTSVTITESTLDCIDVFAANIALDINHNTIDSNYEMHPRCTSGETDYAVYMMMMAYDLKFDSNKVSNAIGHVVAINGGKGIGNFATAENNSNEVQSFTGNVITGISGSTKNNRAGFKVWDDLTYAFQGEKTYEELPQAGQDLINNVEKANTFQKAEETSNNAYKMNFYEYYHVAL